MLIKYCFSYRFIFKKKCDLLDLIFVLRYLYSFEEFYRKLGCTMVNHPRTSRNRNRSNRSLIRDKDKTIKTEAKIELKVSLKNKYHLHKL